MSNDDRGALVDLRVVDLGGAMTAYCSKLLTELGASVVFVEPPGGDELRGVGPFVDGADGDRLSLLFGHYRAGQRSITLDVGADESRPVLAALASRADVVLISPSGQRPLAGFDDARLELEWQGPDLVVCAITGYGLTGPHLDRRVTPLVSEAASGAMFRLGPPEGPPRALPGRQAWDAAGAYAAFAVLAALRVRDAIGGQLIDLSAHEVTAAHEMQVDQFDINGTVLDRARLVGIPPNGVWEAGDGPINVSCHQLHHWDAFLDMLGNPAELMEPAFKDPMIRRELHDVLRELIQPLLTARSRLDLFARGQELGLPCALVYTPAEFLADEQVVAREFSQAATWDSRQVVLPGTPFGARSPLVRPRRVVPVVGSANREVYVDELAFPADLVDEWKDRSLV